MTKDNYFIDISKQKDVFKEHLGLEQNERIIFSAKFGDGKTTFLREFFKNNPEYNAIHLYPVTSIRKSQF
jgi:tRNA A37 threonylcarbamoyladenosine biosynthesis protein TsaE